MNRDSLFLYISQIIPNGFTVIIDSMADRIEVVICGIIEHQLSRRRASVIVPVFIPVISGTISYIIRIVADTDFNRVCPGGMC